MTLFDKPGDYAAFERAMAQAHQAVSMRLLAYCLMPNHWHLVLQPYHDGDLGRYMHRLTTTHVRRWHAHRHSVGLGHLYQGTYKSFPIQDDIHFLTVCRYVERNAHRAGLIEQAGPAEAWRWSSAWRRDHPEVDHPDDQPPLTTWPTPRPRHWKRLLNEPLPADQLAALRQTLRRGRPFGDASWQSQTADRLGLQSTLRHRGRPRKAD
jgi:putative transposase